MKQSLASAILPDLVVHSGNEDIKLMLAQHSITLERPDPPFDTAMIRVRDSGYEWLVIRFFNQTDSGYAAFGLPQHVPQEQQDAAWQFLLETLREMAIEGGGNGTMMAVDLPPLSQN